MKSTFNKKLSDVRVVLDKNVVNDYLKNKMENRESFNIKKAHNGKRKSNVPFKEEKGNGQKKLKQMTMLSFFQMKTTNNTQEKVEIQTNSETQVESTIIKQEFPDTEPFLVCEPTGRPIAITYATSGLLKNGINHQNNNVPVDEIDEKPISINDDVYFENGTYFSHNIQDSTVETFIKSQPLDENYILIKEEFQINDKSFDPQMSHEDSNDIDIETIESDIEEFHLQFTDEEVSDIDIETLSHGNFSIDDSQEQQRKKIYYCDYCNFECRRKHQIRLHIIKEHSIESPSKLCTLSVHDIGVVSDEKIKLFCGQCNETFDLMSQNRSRYVKICPNCNSKLKAKCLKCTKLFGRVDTAKIHVQVDCNPKKCHKCTDCDYYTASKGDLHIHFQQSHFNGYEKDIEKSKEIRKKDCLKLVTSEAKTAVESKKNIDNDAFGKSDIRTYLQNEHNKVLRCSKCGKEFSLENACKQHILTCGKNFYKCKYCEKTWPLATSGIKEHLRREHIERIGKSNLNKVRDEIYKLAHENKVKTLKSIHEKNKTSGKIECPLFIDDDVELHCKYCKRNFKFERHKFRSYAKDCPDCGRDINIECKKCKKLFSQLATAKFHILYQCDPQLYLKCIICDYVTKSFMNLRSHNRKVHPEVSPKSYHPIPVNEIKNKSVSAKDQEYKFCHYSNVSRGTTYFCDNCNFKTYHKGDIRAHILSEHPVDTGIKHCSKCGKLFKMKCYLEQHLLTCGLRAYKCAFCTKSWSKGSEYIKEHMIRMHAKEIGKANIDDIRDEIFKRARETKANILKSINEERKLQIGVVMSIPDDVIKVHCYKCKKSYDPVRGKFNRFDTICQKCNTKMQFECPKCKKLFGTAFNAKAHYSQICNTQLLFKCKYCDLTSNRKRSLFEHINRMHPNEKVHSDDSEMSSMSVILKRDDEKANKFTTSNGSTIFIGTEKRIARGFTAHCNDCDYIAYSKKEITIHILKEHPADPNTNFCSKCGFKFLRISLLKLHELTCGLVKYRCKYCANYWNATTSIKYHLIKMHSTEIGTKNVDDVYNDIIIKFNENKRQVLRSLVTEKKTGKITIDGKQVTSDESVEMYCNKCKKVSNVIRTRRRAVINECKKCSSILISRCLKCKKTFETVDRVKAHVELVCDPPEIYKCTECDYKTPRKLYMSKHMKNSHKMYGNSVVKSTDQSRMTINTEKELQKKNESVPSEISASDNPERLNISRGLIYYCNECDFKTFHKNGIRLHIMKEHVADSNSLHCPKCGTVYICKRTLDQHVLTCGLNNFKCTYCEKSWPYVHSKVVRLHLKTHHAKEFELTDFDVIISEIRKKAQEIKVNFLKSMQKNKKASDNIIIKEKMVISDDEFRMYCKKCNDHFEVKRGKWNVPVKDCENCNTEMEAKCMKCKKLFSNFRNARKHYEEVCNPQFFFKCNDCDYTCTRRCYLHVHAERLHNKLPPRKRRKLLDTGDPIQIEDEFPVMNKSSKSEGCFNKNIATRPAMLCYHCDFKAFMKSQLQLHILSNHSVDADTIYCLKCGKIFKKKSTLEYHMLLCGLSEYTCKFCPKVWTNTSKSGIKRHLKTVHKKEIGSNDATEIVREILRQMQPIKKHMRTIADKKNDEYQAIR